MKIGMRNITRRWRRLAIGLLCGGSALAAVARSWRRGCVAGGVAWLRRGGNSLRRKAWRKGSAYGNGQYGGYRRCSIMGETSSRQRQQRASGVSKRKVASWHRGCGKSVAKPSWRQPPAMANRS